jgi:methyltransferase
VESQWLYLGLVALVAVERLVELRIAARNARRALERGGFEMGAGHYRVMKVLHTAFLVACPLEVWAFGRPFVAALGLPMLGLLAGTMALRYWVVATLGDRWNTRVVVVPGERPIRRGPYRWLRHPNYVGVVVELAALPLVHMAWVTALVFGMANLALLRVRIRVEEAALAKWTPYEHDMQGTPRFLPGRGDA